MVPVPTSRSGLGSFLLLAAALPAGCAPAADRSFDSRDPVARMSAIADTAAAGDRTKIPELIGSLDHSDPAVRFMAAATLRELTGETMGYRPQDPEPLRDAAIARWESWYALSRNLPPSRHPAPSER